MIILYSTGCPRCRILKAKLAVKEIDFEEINDEDAMVEIGLTEVPSLQVDGRILGFMDAIDWVNRQ